MFTQHRAFFGKLLSLITVLALSLIYASCNSIEGNKQTVEPTTAVATPNASPICDPTALTIQVDKGAESGTIAPSCSDPDGDVPLTYSVVRPPQYGDLSASDFTGTNATGIYHQNRPTTSPIDSFEINISDSKGAAIPFVVTIGIQHPLAPVCTPSQISVTADSEGKAQVSLTCSDPNGGALSYDFSNGPWQGLLSGLTGQQNTGAYQQLHESGLRQDTFNATVSNGKLTTLVPVSVNINFNPPTCDPLVLAVPIGQSVNFTLSCKDLDNNTLTYSLLKPPPYGSLTGLGINTSSGTYTSDAATFPLDQTMDQFTVHVSNRYPEKFTDAIVPVIIVRPLTCTLGGNGYRTDQAGNRFYRVNTCGASEMSIVCTGGKDLNRDGHITYNFGFDIAPTYGAITWAHHPGTNDQTGAGVYQRNSGINQDKDEVTIHVTEEGGTTLSLPVIVRVCTPGDWTEDNHVDMADFFPFQTCFNGPGRPPAGSSPNECLCHFDFDDDLDVDTVTNPDGSNGGDFGVYNSLFTGPLTPLCPTP